MPAGRELSFVLYFLYFLVSIHHIVMNSKRVEPFFPLTQLIVYFFESCLQIGNFTLVSVNHSHLRQNLALVSPNHSLVLFTSSNQHLIVRCSLYLQSSSLFGLCLLFENLYSSSLFLLCLLFQNLLPDLSPVDSPLCA